MASRTALLVTLVSLASWIVAGSKTVKEVLEMEEKLGNDLSEWDPRIIGGRPAEQNEFPWTVPLHYNGRFICTSFLVTPNFLMTAAHCVVLRGDDAEPPERFNGYVGTVQRDGPDTEILFSEVIAHKDYGDGTEYDIALLKLKTPIQKSDRVQTICLPSKGSKFDDTIAQAMGWGVYQKGGRDPSPVLLTVPEHVPQLSQCQATYRLLGIPVTARHVCAGGSDTGVCFGDSGGPLVYSNSTRPLAIGVASFVSYWGCATRRVPAVYTSTNSYLDWIQENLGDSASDLCVV